MATETNQAWSTAAILIGRLIFAAVFIMAATFKFIDVDGTAGRIRVGRLPHAHDIGMARGLFELALIAGFLTGAYFSEAALLATAYVLFLAFGFHGPSHWAANQAEFGFFVDHFTFAAGLLFAAVHGPGHILAIKAGWLRR